MKNSQFAKPLIQSALVLVLFLSFFLIINTTHPASAVESIAIIVTTFFKGFVFLLGLSLAVIFSVGMLFFIFFTAVTLFSSEQSGSLYNALTERINDLFLSITDCQCSDSQPLIKIPQQEYDKLAKEVTTEQNKATALQANINSLKNQLKENLEDKTALKDSLKKSEETITNIEEQLSAEKETSAELKNKQEAVQNQYDKAIADNKALIEEKATLEKKLSNLNKVMEQSPVAGIFSYFDNDDDKALFAEKVEEAVNQEMTYAQIDEFLSTELPDELDTIVKDHPSLTKNYIRNLRR